MARCSLLMEPLSVTELTCSLWCYCANYDSFVVFPLIYILHDGNHGRVLIVYRQTIFFISGEPFCPLSVWSKHNLHRLITASYKHLDKKITRKFGSYNQEKVYAEYEAIAFCECDSNVIRRKPFLNINTNECIDANKRRIHREF